jgi:hypothetical protein
MNGLTVPDVMPLVWNLYASPHGSVGGCLHIVLDDGNVKDSHVQYCIEHAVKNGCTECATLGVLLERMSETQRMKVARHAYCERYRHREREANCACAAWAASPRPS